MVKPHTERNVGDGPWTVVLWCKKRPAIISGLDRYPVVGDQFDVGDEMWRVVDTTGSYICERESS